MRAERHPTPRSSFLPSSIAVAAMLAVLAAFAMVPDIAAAVGFATEPLASGGYGVQSGGYDIATTPDGRVHLLMKEESGGSVRSRIAVRGPGGWTFERLPFANVDDAAMMVDPDGTLHLVVADPNDDLWYVHREDGQWSKTKVADVDARFVEIGRFGDDRLEIGARHQSTYEYHLYWSIDDGASWDTGGDAAFFDTGEVDFAWVTGRARYAIYHQYAEPRRIMFYERNDFTSGSIPLDDDLAAGAGATVDMVVGPSGNPHMVSSFVPQDGSAVVRYRDDPETYEEWAGNFAALAIDGSGDPHILYRVGDSHRRYRWREDDTWYDRSAPPGISASALTIGPRGQLQAIMANEGGGVEFLTAGLFLDHPVGGEVLPAGGPCEVRWLGAGEVTVELSTDDGQTWTPLVQGVTGGRAVVDLPQVASDRARLRLVRPDPFATSTSPGTFTLAPAASGDWASAPVVGAAPDAPCDAAVGPDGTTHVVWISDTGTPALHHAEGRADAWTVTTLDATTEPAGRPAIALSPAGEPAVAYLQLDEEEAVGFARRSGGTWSVSFVDGTQGAESDVSLAFDEAGSVHLAYYDGARHQLGYGRLTGGSWSLEDVLAGQVEWGIQHDLAVTDGRVWIAFHEGGSESFQLAWRPLGDGAWSGGTIQSYGQVGMDPALTATRDGDLHLVYRRDDGPTVRYLHRDRWGQWTAESLPVNPLGSPRPIQLDVDAEGSPMVLDLVDGQWTLLRRAAPGVWSRTTVGVPAGDLATAALAAGPDGQPRVVAPDPRSGELRHLSRGLHLTQPEDGEIWPVGAMREVRWWGFGDPHVELSIDGGASWQPLAGERAGNSLRLQVPHLPTRFARVRLVREAPAAVLEMPGLFTIESSIDLLQLQAEARSGGVALRWRTDPGPEDLAGFAVDRATDDGSWTRVASDLTGDTYVDPDGHARASYRLVAVNGLGEELVLGETTAAVSAALAVWPRPFSGGDLTISFVPFGRLGEGRAEVAIYDLRGRLVREVATGSFAADTPQTVTWDGRDAQGRQVSSGVYFVTVRSAGEVSREKLTVVR